MLKQLNQGNINIFICLTIDYIRLLISKKNRNAKIFIQSLFAFIIYTNFY